MILEFGILNFKLIIPLLYPIFSVANKIITKTLLKSPHILLSSPLFTSFMRSISYLLSGLPYLLVLYKSRNKKLSTTNNSKVKKNTIELIYINNRIKRNIKKFTSLFLLSLLNMVPVIIDTAVLLSLKKLKEEIAIYQKINEEFEDRLGVLFSVLFYVFYSKIFLNIKVYFHQIIFLLAIFFCVY